MGTYCLGTTNFDEYQSRLFQFLWLWATFMSNTCWETKFIGSLIFDGNGQVTSLSCAVWKKKGNHFVIDNINVIIINDEMVALFPNCTRKRRQMSKIEKDEKKS